jgi:uncharacterized membrane protein YeaQ/YmgE (transglycosylase-associated protein family)
MGILPRRIGPGLIDSLPQTMLQCNSDAAGANWYAGKRGDERKSSPDAADSAVQPTYPGMLGRRAAGFNREGYMSLEGLLIFLLIGLIAGWLAGQIMRGGGFGLVGDIVVGVLGAFIGGFLLPRIGLAIGGGFVADVINALIGAIILLFVLRLIKR